MQAASNFIQNKVQGQVPIDVDPKGPTAAHGHSNPELKMKALAWFGTNDVRLVEVDMPQIIHPDDVIVQVTGTTICGSDIHLYKGELMTMEKGDILGHEFIGKVHQAGTAVKNVKPGDRVVASFQIACGECEWCKQKLSTFCDRTNDSSLMQSMYGHRLAGIFGYSHLTGGFAGGQAEYVRVPRGHVNLLAIPDNVPDEKALYLSDVLPTSYHNVVDTGVKEGDVVAVWGLGPIGLCAARWALLKGAKRVIGLDKVPERLSRATNLLGIEVVDIKQHTDVSKKLKELVPRGLDVALECSTFHEPKTIMHKMQKILMLEQDVPENLNEMFLSVRKGGRVGVIADYVGYVNGLNIGAVMEKGIKLFGNGQAPTQKYWEEILNEYVIPGKFDPNIMLTHRVPLEDLPKLYEAFSKREGGVEKVFIETRFSAPPAPGTPALSRVEEWANVQM